MNILQKCKSTLVRKHLKTSLNLFRYKNNNYFPTDFTLLTAFCARLRRKISERLNFLRIFSKVISGFPYLDKQLYTFWLAAFRNILDIIFSGESSRAVLVVSWTRMLLYRAGPKVYKGGYRLVSKTKEEGFEADLYIKHFCTCALCFVQYRHTGR